MEELNYARTMARLKLIEPLPDPNLDVTQTPPIK